MRRVAESLGSGADGGPNFWSIYQEVIAKKIDLAQAVAGLSFAGEVTEEPIDIPGTDEALVLSTCNRVEVMACAAPGVETERLDQAVDSVTVSDSAGVVSQVHLRKAGPMPMPWSSLPTVNQSPTARAAGKVSSRPAG